MLVFSRYADEKIVINGNIVVTVVRFKSGKVYLGVEAPREVPVHRGEVQERITAEQNRKEPE